WSSTLHRKLRDTAQVKLARAARGFIERERLQRDTYGATVLQSCWRGYKARKA
ncbi:unnamed protein product, partial [Hapterophycus canaliculatus]